ncbi:MAG: Uroporphyrinogen-III synthase HemD [Ignavibacteria bacterium]|nr:MAG: Uroporphyrinogen-III synthase HemD [Ignavibacteria bacterium]KAF0161000.1 MAG: Uroporphyrinogen-III synthase HemD [Ignavibacteria bacterium]
MSGKVILVTKSKTYAEKHFCSLLAAGFEIVYFPTIQIKPQLDSEELRRGLENFNEFDWIIFTSTNAVEVFYEIAVRKNIKLKKIKIACVGSETAERCRQKNIRVNLVPYEFSAAGLVKEFAKVNLIDKKVFIPCSGLSRSELKLELAELGADVTSVPIYDAVVNDEINLISEIEIINKKKPDVFVFTSPSSFNNYLVLMNIESPAKYFEHNVVCSIGSTTEAAITANNVYVSIVPESFSLSGVKEAIKKYFSIEKNIA